MFTFLLIYLSILMSFMYHPLSMLTVILAMSLSICFYVFYYSLFSWFSYILFLIFLGSLLVLFIYVASLAPNEKFKVSSKMIISTMALSLAIIYCLSLLTLINKSSTSLPVTTSHMNQSILQIYSASYSFPTITIISYLLLALVIMVKIIQKKDGTLRTF